MTDFGKAQIFHHTSITCDRDKGRWVWDFISQDSPAIAITHTKVRAQRLCRTLNQLQQEFNPQESSTVAITADAETTIPPGIRCVVVSADTPALTPEQASQFDVLLMYDMPHNKEQLRNWARHSHCTRVITFIVGSPEPQCMRQNHLLDAVESTFGISFVPFYPPWQLQTPNPSGSNNIQTSRVSVGGQATPSVLSLQQLEQQLHKEAENRSHSEESTQMLITQLVERLQILEEKERGDRQQIEQKDITINQLSQQVERLEEVIQHLNEQQLLLQQQQHYVEVQLVNKITEIETLVQNQNLRKDPQSIGSNIKSSHPPPPPPISQRQPEYSPQIRHQDTQPHYPSTYTESPSPYPQYGQQLASSYGSQQQQQQQPQPYGTTGRGNPMNYGRGQRERMNRYVPESPNPDYGAALVTAQKMAARVQSGHHLDGNLADQ